MCLMVTADVAANMTTSPVALNHMHMHENLICPYKTSKAEVPYMHTHLYRLLNFKVFLTYEGWTKSQLTS